jgi:hypothetical protein
MIYRNRFITSAVAALLAAAGFAGATRSGPAIADDFRPLAQAFGITSCSSRNPCVEGKNANLGPGIEGISSKGSGVVGQTKFNSTSSAGQAGVIGQDLSTSGFANAGVLGSSTFGNGISGTTSRGRGVSGIASSNGAGVFGQGLVGVFAVSQSGNASSDALLAAGNSGLLIRASNNGGQPTDVFTVDPAGNTAISGNAIISGNTTMNGVATLNGGALFGNSITVNGTVVASKLQSSGNAQIDNGLTVFGPLSQFNAALANGIGAGVFGGTAAGAPVLSVLEAAGPTDMIQSINTVLTDVFRVDDSGNVHITGQIFTSGACNSGCAKGPAAPGRHVLSYAPRESLPTMEDVGEAQLVNGTALVSLDPAFANVIDGTTPYLVFITPEGMVNGSLCVTDRSPHGFTVRESGGGHSTVAFAYRIVAKPYGERAARLPMIDLKPMQRNPLNMRRRPR